MIFFSIILSYKKVETSYLLKLEFLLEISTMSDM